MSIKKIIGSILCATVLTACSNDNEVRIGVAGPFTGAYAAFGEQLIRGAQQAADDINAAGGVQHKKVRIVELDDACEPKQAVAVANRAIDHDHVHAMIGHFCSSSTIPASEVYADSDILMITPASTNPAVTDRGLQTVLRTCGRDDQQGSVAADFIMNHLHAKRVAVIHDKDTYGQGLADSMKDSMRKHGQNEVIYEGLTRGEKDFNALVTKLKATNVDAVYFGGLHTEAGPLVKQMREQGLSVPFISGDGIVTEEFVTAAGGKQFVSNVYMTFGADPRKIPSNKAVIEKFRSTGYEPEGYTLYAYTTMQVIANAMNATNSKSGKVLSNYLKQNTVDTIMGKESWDEKGDLKKSNFVMYAWKNDGTYSQL
jgi:branched-chain amino acid transport system substrate-binding protein